MVEMNSSLHQHTSDVRTNVPQWMPMECLDLMSLWISTACAGSTCWGLMNHLLTHTTLVICSDVCEEVCCFCSSVLRTQKHLVDRHNMGDWVSTMCAGIRIQNPWTSCCRQNIYNIPVMSKWISIACRLLTQLLTGTTSITLQWHLNQFLLLLVGLGVEDWLHLYSRAAETHSPSLPNGEKSIWESQDQIRLAPKRTWMWTQKS